MHVQRVFWTKFPSTPLLVFMLGVGVPNIGKADLVSSFAQLGMTLAGSALDAAKSNSKEVVIAGAKTPAEIDVEGNEGFLAGISITAEADKDKGHAKTTSSANANLLPFIFKNQVQVVPEADPENSKAAGYARAGSRASFRGVPGTSSTTQAGPEAIISLDLDINLSSTGLPSAVALSVNDLLNNQFDSSLGVDPLLTPTLSRLNLEAAMPTNTYITVMASLSASGLQVTATDYLGNTLLRPSDFSVSSAGGIMTASYTGRVSTVKMISLDTEYQLNIEDHSSAEVAPEPSSVFLFCAGVLCFFGFGRVFRTTAKYASLFF